MKYTYAQLKSARHAIEGGVQDIGLDEISGAVGLCPSPQWTGDNLISAGTRVQYGGNVYIALVDLYDLNNYKPSADTEGTLWAKAEFRDGYRIIPSVMLTATLFQKGACGWWHDSLYRSLIDNNSWTPDAYPAGWQKID